MDLTNNEFDFIKQLLHLIFTCDTVDEIEDCIDTISKEKSE